MKVFAKIFPRKMPTRKKAKRKVRLEESYHMLHPRPVVLISTFWKKPNVMTCAWTTPVCDDPAIVAIVLGNQSYTAKMIMESREFVINIPSKQLLPKVVKCGECSGKNVDKAKKFGLTYSKAKKIKCPIVDECVGHLECKLLKALKFNGCNIFVAKVVGAYADRSYFTKCWKKSIPEHLAGKIFCLGKIKK